MGECVLFLGLCKNHSLAFMTNLANWIFRVMELYLPVVAAK